MVREIDKRLAEREVQNRRQLPPATRSGSAQMQMRGESPVGRNDDRRMEDDEYGRGRESPVDLTHFKMSVSFLFFWPY